MMQSGNSNVDRISISGIPPEAEERVAAHYPDGAKQDAEYWLNGQRVGFRYFSEQGNLEAESPQQDGLRHSVEYHWYESGRLLSAEPYERGVAHGTARQWAEDGRLIGTYTMEHGTGIDLWWQVLSDGTVYLAEVHYMCAGKPHGFDWWLTHEGSLWWEYHWRHFARHGIEREWNADGRLRRGYPRYWINGERVTRRQYLKAAAKDHSLPPFRPEENEPHRTFPSEIARHLRPELSQDPSSDVR